MHKARFLARHRLAIAYSHRYVLTVEDLTGRKFKPTPELPVPKTEAEITELHDQLLEGFDPAN